MSLASRVQRLEAKAGTGKAPLLIVYEDEDGEWTTSEGERVERDDVPANAQVVVIGLRPDGPQ
jgi:hypothetical protein